MIHVLTVHYRSCRWIPPQRACLEAFCPEPHRVMCSIEDVAPSRAHAAVAAPVRAAGSDRETRGRWLVIGQEGSHADKLNALARRVIAACAADDVLVFLDGDALPVADLSEVLASARAGELVAVRRDENVGDPQPHPSFCAVRADVWRELPGDWAPGPTWTDSVGRPATDLGARLWETLREQGRPWRPLLRSRDHDDAPHPLWFGIYGDVVYHHGAGFRYAESRLDGAMAEASADGVDARAVWMRRRCESMDALGERVFARIAADPAGTLERCRNGSLFAALEPAA